jgi:carboxymethylenebutenolidase
MNDHIMDLARRFAAEGFNVAAPDLYSRCGPPEAGNMASVLDHMFNLIDARVTADLEIATDHLLKFSNSNGKVGAIGFCSGGRSVLILACSSGLIGAAIDCWGGYIRRATNENLVTPERPTPPIDLAANVKCPFLAVGGEEDENPSPADLAALEDAMKTAKVPGRTRVFTNAGHAFLADYRATYRSEAAFSAWPVLVTFMLDNVAK